MATLQEIAAIRRRMPLGMQTEAANFANPNQATNQPSLDAGPNLAMAGPVTGASGISVGPISIPGIPATSIPMPTPPPASDPALATDAGVNNAYQALMQSITQGDQDKGTYQRQLADQLRASQGNRVRTLLGSHQNMADRGIFNSGIALGTDADLNTQYDQYDFGLGDAFQGQVTGIDRNILGLQTDYENAKVSASAAFSQAQAQAAADALLQQQTAQAQQDQIAQLIAALAPPPAPQLVPTAYNPNYVPYKKPVAKPAPAPVSGQTGHLVLSPHGGPQ